ncbi:MAG TPA: LCP family protein [Actinomycetota bacterium]|nr:LCP family protein [Actinomycetota bacterium]
MRRSAIVIGLVILAWSMGSTVGSISATSARASASILIGKPRVHFAPDLPGRRTITILAVGSDARPGQNPLRLRADSIHLIFLSPRTEHAVVAGIPRDSWVSIPGHGSNKINSALSSGGPPLLVQTVERAFGTRIDYWAVTSFWGIADMVREVGGLKVRVPFRMKDVFSGSDFRPGLRELNGAEVLAFARDRHSVPGGDFGRQENGGRVFLAALAQFQREFLRDPSRLLVWVGAGMRHMDTDLPVGEVISLALEVSDVNRTHVRNIVFPGGTGSVGGSSVVFLSMSSARRIVADARADGALRRGNVPRSPTGHR